MLACSLNAASNIAAMHLKQCLPDMDVTSPHKLQLPFCNRCCIRLLWLPVLTGYFLRGCAVPCTQRLSLQLHPLSHTSAAALQSGLRAATCTACAC